MSWVLASPFGWVRDGVTKYPSSNTFSFVKVTEKGVEKE
jgi:hypothetical protein